VSRTVGVHGVGAASDLVWAGTVLPLIVNFATLHVSAMCTRCGAAD
jgi:hypothetical protein